MMIWNWTASDHQPPTYIIDMVSIIIIIITVVLAAAEAAAMMS